MTTPESRKKVLLLGAGASRASHFKLPMMREFFGPNIENVPDPLRHFLGWFYPNSSPDSFNLEEVLIYLSISASRTPAWMGQAAPLLSSPPVSLDDVLTFVEQTSRSSRSRNVANVEPSLHKEAPNLPHVKSRVPKLNLAIVSSLRAALMQSLAHHHPASGVTHEGPVRRAMVETGLSGTCEDRVVILLLPSFPAGSFFTVLFRGDPTRVGNPMESATKGSLSSHANSRLDQVR